MVVQSFASFFGEEASDAWATGMNEPVDGLGAGDGVTTVTEGGGAPDATVFVAMISVVDEGKWEHLSSLEQ